VSYGGPGGSRLPSHSLRTFPLVACLAFIAGCPSSQGAAGASADAQAAQPCLRVGQTCEYAPNKLGSCVQRDNCTQDCLVCQSQH
jgi:hypothetical protein